MILFITSEPQKRCPNDPPPLNSIKTIFDTEAAIAILMMSGKINTILCFRGEKAKEAEKVLERTDIEVRDITSPDVSRLMEEISLTLQKIPENPSMEKGLKGWARELFDKATCPS